MKSVGVKAVDDTFKVSLHEDAAAIEVDLFPCFKMASLIDNIPDYLSPFGIIAYAFRLLLDDPSLNREITRSVVGCLG